jgi:hypothetical protein
MKSACELSSFAMSIGEMADEEAHIAATEILKRGVPTRTRVVNIVRRRMLALLSRIWEPQATNAKAKARVRPKH